MRQVDDHLGDRVLVAIDAVRWRSGLPPRIEAVLAQVQLLPFPHAREDRMQIERSKVVALLAPFHAREVEHIVDQAPSGVRLRP